MRAGKPTNPGSSSGCDAGAAVFPSDLLTREGGACAHTFTHIKAVSEAVSSEFPKPRGENQNQQTEEQSKLCLAFFRIDKSAPTPVNNQTSLLLAQRREHPPPNTCNKTLAITALSPGN